MTVFEWAMYTCAARWMLPDEKARAQALAERADAGDKAAAGQFRKLALAVLADAKRREKEGGVDVAQDGRKNGASGSGKSEERGDVG